MTIPAIAEVFHNLSNIEGDMRLNLPQLQALLEDTRKAVVRSKYAAAVATYVHMDADTQLDLVEDVAVDATQATVNIRANLLKSVAVAHAANVGSATEDGVHKTADTVATATLVAIAAASSLPTAITLINGLLAWINAHRVAATVHFTNDTTAVTITTNPPTTLAHCITDLNDLLLGFQAHFDLAAP